MKSMTGILENLVFISARRNLLYVTDTTAFNLKPTRKFEHLSCFFPGLLALGADTLPESFMSKEQRELHMWAAEGLAHTCWVMYADQPSGLGPEIAMFDGWKTDASAASNDHWKQERWMTHVERWEQEGRIGGKPPGVGNAGLPLELEESNSENYRMTDYKIYTSSYLLRPEVSVWLSVSSLEALSNFLQTLESMFLLYRTTRDPKWRERGWEIWKAIESKTRTNSGYASVYGVQKATPSAQDSMPRYVVFERSLW